MARKLIRTPAEFRRARPPEEGDIEGNVLAEEQDYAEGLDRVEDISEISFLITIPLEAVRFVELDINAATLEDIVAKERLRLQSEAIEGIVAEPKISESPEIFDARLFLEPPNIETLTSRIIDISDVETYVQPLYPVDPLHVEANLDYYYSTSAFLYRWRFETIDYLQPDVGFIDTVESYLPRVLLSQDEITQIEPRVNAVDDVDIYTPRSTETDITINEAKQEVPTPDEVETYLTRPIVVDSNVEIQQQSVPSISEVDAPIIRSEETTEAISIYDQRIPPSLDDEIETKAARVIDADLVDEGTIHRAELPVDEIQEAKPSIQTPAEVEVSQQRVVLTDEEPDIITARSEPADLDINYLEARPNINVESPPETARTEPYDTTIDTAVSIPRISEEEINVNSIISIDVDDLDISKIAMEGLNLENVQAPISAIQGLDIDIRMELHRPDYHVSEIEFSSERITLSDTPEPGIAAPASTGEPVEIEEHDIEHYISLFQGEPPGLNELT